MIFQIAYQIQLLNGNKIKSMIKVEQGQQISEIKKKIIQFQGFNNENTFKLMSNILTKDNKVNQQTKILKFKEQRKKGFGSVISVRSRKMSDDSMFQQQSIIFQDNPNQNYIQSQPQIPPIICGYVTFPNSFFFCFSSKKYLVLDTQTANFYQSKQSNILFKSVKLQQIHQIKSYKRKHFYCIRLIIERQQINLKFINKDVCKQWVGYFYQMFNFNNFLNQKKAFSKKQSFQKYVQTFQNYKNNLQSTKIINLNDSEQTIVYSVHTNISCQSSFKKNFNFIIKLSSFQITHKIDSGSFSTIYLAKKNGKQLALKQMNKQKLLYKGQIKYAMTQLNCLIKSRSCPYIIPIYYAFQTHEYLYLALKFISYGNLARLIKKKKKIQEDQAIILIAQLIVAIQYLHNKKILYRDLKPENILLDQNGHIYLTDFGLAKQLEQQNQTAHSFLGTPLYLAPQRFIGDSYGIDYKSDIYAVGMIFFQMLHGYHPFQADNFNSVIYNIKNTQIQIDQNLSKQTKSFLIETLQKDQNKRIQKMNNHNLFKRIDWKKINRKQHQGIKLQKQNINSMVQINYPIDLDYNEQNYPDKKISKWNFNYEHQHQR